MPSQKAAAVATLAAVLAGTEALTFTGHLSKANDLAVEESSQESTANPIRKVVTLLQKMSKKVEEEGKAETKLYEKYTCYCKTTKAELETDIKRLTGPDQVTQADIDAAQGELDTTSADITTLKDSRTAALKSLAEAEAQRKKTAAEFKAASAAEAETASAAEQAVGMLKRGPAGEALLQQKAKTTLPILKKALLSQSDKARAEVLALLSGGKGSPDMVIGTLNNIKDEADKAHAALVKDEDRSIAQFLRIKSSKSEEVGTLLDQVQRKNQRVAELRVQIVDKKHELKNAANTLAANQQMLTEVTAGCAAKAKTWDERQKTRANEQLGLSEAIKTLNSDEALDQFKKTLPSLLQTTTGKEAEKALKIVKSVKANAELPELNFLAMALSGKKVNFDKVNKMIDDMIAMMAKQTKDDETKKDYCEDAFYNSDRNQATLKRDIGDVKASVKDSKQNIKTLDAQIENLESSIAAIEKTEKEAADDRAKEAAQVKDLLAENTMAIALLKKATNILNRFYNPQLFVQTTTPSPYDPYALVQVEGGIKIQKPPKTFSDTYVANKESLPVFGMIQSLESDLTQEIKVAESDEKFSQGEYGRAMAAAAKKKSTDQDALSAKNQAKADYEQALAGERSTQESKEAELKAAEEVDRNLHGECDWLLNNFILRRGARTQEADALKRAKATLAGAEI